jgi:hypothetical protein
LHTFITEKSSQLGYHGNVITFPQDIGELAAALPRTGPLIICVVKKATCPRARDRVFHVRRQRVYDALTWLQANNKYYTDVDIDAAQLLQLPDDGAYKNGIEYVVDPNLDAEDDAQIPDDEDVEVAAVMANPRSSNLNATNAANVAKDLLDIGDSTD